MKKLKLVLLTTVLTVLVGNWANAQNELKIGVKGGINLANLYIDDVEDENMKVGLNLGLFAKVPVSDALSIQPEILYSSKGAKATYDNFVFGEGELRFNLNYIEVPILAVINLGENFNIHVGPYAGFLASANIKDMDEDGSIDDAEDLDVDNFNRFDYGLTGGVGFEVNGFTIGARYVYGLNEVAKSDKFTGDLLGDSKNSVISAFVGFGF